MDGLIDLLIQHPSLIASVQQVTVTIAANQLSGTATLPRAVNAAKTILMFNNSLSADATLNPAEEFPGTTLTDGLTITCSRNTANVSDARTCKVIAWELQPWALKGSVQYGTVTSVAATTANQAISSVSLSRAALVYLGQTTDRTAYNVIRDSASIDLQATNNVRMTRGNGTNNITGYFCVFEFAEGIVDSIQNFLVVIAASASSGTATLSPTVTPGQTLLVSGGWHMSVLGVDDKRSWPRVDLTDGSTITATCNTASGAQLNCRVFAIAFKRQWVKKKTAVSITITSGNASNTAAVSIENLNKTILSFLGATTDTNSASNAPWGTLDITSKSVITATRGSSPATALTINGEAFEFA